MPIRQITVIGTGLIGGSLGLALKKHRFAGRIIGCDRAPVLERARTKGAIDDGHTNPADAARGSQVIVLAAPVGAILDLIARLGPALPPKTLLTDTGSTKAEILARATAVFGKQTGRRFLAGHPMAGKEQSGIDHADADLFRGAPYALIGPSTDADSRVKNFANVIEAIGGTPVWSDTETHDWAVGITSHLPQLVAVALARVVQDETDETGLPLSLAGTGLQDMLRLAGSPYDVWRDVFLTNTENAARALDRMGQALDYLRTRLTSKELSQEFQGANEVAKLLREKTARE
jgi:prephenate dehydrogenase